MKVLICGGGIAGLTLALCLERAGHKALVVDKAPRLRDEGYMLDFYGPGYEASEKLGIIPDLERIRYPIARLTFVDGNGRQRFSLSVPKLRQRWFNGRHFNLTRGDLERVLYEMIVERVQFRFGTTVDSFEQADGRVNVRLSDGSTDAFDLLVGADGVHSRIRRLLLGDESQFVHFLGCYTAAFIVRNPPSNLNPADAFVTLAVPRRQVAIYPIRGNATAALLVHSSDRVITDFSKEAALRELRSEYSGMRWVVPTLVERAADADGLYFDAVSQVEAARWSVGRVVLLGDACQCLSMMAGAGASMALAAAYILAEELERAGEDVATALTRYERRLRPNIERKQATGRSIAKWFVPESAARLAVRDLILRASTWPVVSSLLARQLDGESILEA